MYDPSMNCEGLSFKKILPEQIKPQHRDMSRLQPCAGKSQR